MTLPPIDPDVSTSGISVDPKTLERVVASTRRPDGSMRKEIKIRPGFTPQEDVGRFRSQRQQVEDARKAGPRVVPGWVPPPQKKPPKPKSNAGKAVPGAPKKTEKAKAKEKEKEKAPVKDSWEDEDEEDKGKVNQSDATAGPPKADEQSTEGTTEQKEVDAEVDSLTEDLAAAKIA